MLALASLLIPFAVYISTLAATYVLVDSSEFALCINYWGVCHPPGFPLYTLVGKIFVLIFPFGSLIYKVNLLSAIFGALSVFLLYNIISRITRDKLLSFLLCLLFASSSIFWEYAIAADVFVFGTFLTALVFYFVFLGRSNFAFFVLGMAASHFYLSAIMLLPILWYFWPKKRSALWQFLVFSLGLFTLGFWPQVVMYFRMQAEPAVNWGHVASLGQYIDFVRRREFGSFFLLQTEATKFSFTFLFKHVASFAGSIFVNMGLILPIVALVFLVWGKFWKDKKIVFAVVCFFLLSLAAIVVLATFDPTVPFSPFPVGKFYLVPLTAALLVVGFGLKLFEEKVGQRNLILLLLALLVLISLFVNFGKRNFKNLLFSESLVLDALSTLPAGSLAIVVDHFFYFNSLLEQKVNRRFADVTLVYFANETNRDGERYNPEVFAREVDGDFVAKVAEGKNLGRSERYILDTIARNLDRPVYILMGGFEETYFDYIFPYLKPQGLWWQVDATGQKIVDVPAQVEILSKFRNQDIDIAKLPIVTLKVSALSYYVAYNFLADELVGVGRYDEAVGYLREVLKVTTAPELIEERIKAIEELKRK